MAIAQAMCTSFKKELLEGVHNFKNSGGDTFKLALFAEGSGGKSSTTATLGATTTALVTTGEVASSGTYVTGGLALTRVDPTTSGTTAFTDFADRSFTTATITAMGALIYNSSDSNKAVVPEVDGSTLVKEPPPVAYVPLDATSPVVTSAVVVAPNVAVDDDLPPLPSANSANLKVSPPEFLKLCTPSNNSFLKEVHIACAIAILESPYIFSHFLVTT